MSPDFIQSTLARLHELGRLASTPEQEEALENVQSVLSFIEARNETAAFADHVARFDTTPLTPVLSFETRHEAEAWLRDHPSPPNGALIQAAKTLYTLSYSRRLEHRELLRVQTPEALAQEEDGEDEAVTEQESPPPPRQGTRFSLVGLLHWTAFHLHTLERRTSSREEREAIRVAKIAFDFLMHVGEEHGFEEYRATLPAAWAGPLRCFTTRQEADRWLERQPEPPRPEVIAIGDARYSVGYDRVRRLRVLLRIPTQEQWKPRAP